AAAKWKVSDPPQSVIALPCNRLLDGDRAVQGDRVPLIHGIRIIPEVDEDLVRVALNLHRLAAAGRDLHVHTLSIDPQTNHRGTIARVAYRQFVGTGQDTGAEGGPLWRHPIPPTPPARLGGGRPVLGLL